MLNRTENNTNMNTPCSVEGLIALKDNKGRTHIVQRELISHTEDASHIESSPATTVCFVSGEWIRVFLSGEELAKRLGINIAN